MSEPDLKTLWQSQEMEDAPMALADIRALAGKTQSRIRIRNMVEYVACVFVVVAFGAQALHPPNPMYRWGAILVILGAPLICWQLYARGGSRRPPEASAANLMDFHRAELVRQRQMFRSAWLWYFGPMTPGMVVMLTSFFLYPTGHAARISHAQFVGATTTAIVCALVWLVVFLNHRLAAWRIQKKIDDLDALGRG
jgi:hypothetical protein